MSMFCRQCEQTFQSKGCDSVGVCGKSADVANLQDVLLHALKSAAVYGFKARELGARDPKADYFILEGIFATLTNVNFDETAIEKMIIEAIKVRGQWKAAYEQAYQKAHGKMPQEQLPDLVNWQPAQDYSGLLDQAEDVGVLGDPRMDEDIRSLRELLLYGLKGMAAYAHHAWRLGQKDDKVTSFVYLALYSLARQDLDMNQLLALVMGCGEANLTCLEILDRGHTTLFGHPEPTKVKLGHLKGPAIIVSGHELFDLKMLLEQSAGKGVKVYTHGEMLPGLSYPALKKYAHFAGHYGTAWQNQQTEFRNLPAAILMTTNCLQEPDITYQDRIFTTGAVGWSGIEHIPEQAGGYKDFSAVINKAIELGGFKEDNIEKEIMIGFGHHTILSAADKIVAAVKEGAIKHFYLIGGCDGERPGRNYFTKFAENVPDDCLILTLACGKNRINRLDYPEVAGFPKLLDCGQCNDAYSAIVVAKALAGAFNCGINDLPLSLIISWYEQKAVAVLLTLLYLGIQNIKLGPTLPAFITPNVLKVLVEKFRIQPIKTVEEDLVLKNAA